MESQKKPKESPGTARESQEKTGKARKARKSQEKPGKAVERRGKLEKNGER